LLCSLQREDGSVAGEVVWSPVITAQYVLTAYMIGQPIESQRQARFLRYFRQTQTADSGWGLHPESRGYVFVTALVYVALRLLGLSAADPLCLQVRLWLRDHGGVESIPSWGKLWLAMMNLYGYEGINPVLPEAWLLPRALPLHPAQLYCHTRLIYLGFSYLYAVRFRRATSSSSCGANSTSSRLRPSRSGLSATGFRPPMCTSRRTGCCAGSLIWKAGTSGIIAPGCASARCSGSSNTSCSTTGRPMECRSAR